MIYTQFDQIPHSRYEMIMADCPWHFDTYSELGWGKTPQAKYRTMQIRHLKRVPVYDYAAADCVLWFWGLNHMIPQAIEVIEAWGFEVKTSGTWTKRTKNGLLHFGQGYWLRNSDEVYFIATKGNPRVRNRSIRSTIDAPIGEHSEKPGLAYRNAELMVPRGFRLDLFSRRQRRRWDQFGDEVLAYGAAGCYKVSRKAISKKPPKFRANKFIWRGPGVVAGHPANGPLVDVDQPGQVANG